MPPETSRSEQSAVATPAVSSTGLFVQSLLLGVVGAIIGTVLYALFVNLTGIAIGYFGIVTGYLVGRAMMFGSRKVGGLAYQMTAVILTFLSIVAAQAALILWDARDELDFSVTVMYRALKYGAKFPVRAFDHSTANGVITLVVLLVSLLAAWFTAAGRRPKTVARRSPGR